MRINWSLWQQCNKKNGEVGYYRFPCTQIPAILQIKFESSKLGCWRIYKGLSMTILDSPDWCDQLVEGKNAERASEGDGKWQNSNSFWRYVGILRLYSHSSHTHTQTWQGYLVHSPLSASELAIFPNFPPPDFRMCLSAIVLCHKCRNASAYQWCDNSWQKFADVHANSDVFYTL
jgi:hypothetical protein